MSDDPKRVEQQLKNLNVNEDDITNVLLFGQTGVGKSTWINALVNYFKFDSLEEAAVCFLFLCRFLSPENVLFSLQQHDPVFIIPAYCYLDGRRLQLGNATEDERHNEGMSSTKNAKSYIIEYNERKFFTTRKVHQFMRVFDTAGVGDTDGSEEDKANFAI